MRGKIEVTNGFVNAIVEKKLFAINTILKEVQVHLADALEAITQKNTLLSRRINKQILQKWSSIKTRCYNKNTPCYKNYGGRGIKMCDEWLDFWNFREWAYKNGYSEGLTLERIDVNGNYEPSNCKWIPMEEQAINKRNNSFIEYGGKKQTISQWSKELGVGKEVLSYRYRAGWTPEECLLGKKLPENINFQEKKYQNI